MMAMAKNGVNIANLLNNKTNKLRSRNVWPIQGVQDQEEWTRYGYLTRMLNRPSQSILRNLQHPVGSPIFQGPIDYNDRQSFHCAMGWILSMAQCFGILPVAGVRSESPKKLVFKMLSPRTAYAILIMVMLFTMAVTSVCHIIQSVKESGSYDDIALATSYAIFYIASVVRAVCFMWIAARWSSLQWDWRAMERFLDRNNRQSTRLRWKFSLLTTVIMSSALMEHILYFVQLIPQEFWLSDSNWTFGGLLRYICEKAYPFIFNICNYNHCMGIFIIFICTVEPFSLNFTDVFVMLVSMGLAERYKTLNQRLTDITPTSHGNTDWRELRECYATLSTLVKKVDENVSHIILVSFASNFFSICLQLRNGLSPHENSVFESIYFFYSFANIVSKTVTVMLLAARINDQSRLALPKLYNCPEPAYNIEAQRLQQQLSTDEVCLTGMGFFEVTRSFVLTVASTIVTYAVLLLNSTSQ